VAITALGCIVALTAVGQQAAQKGASDRDASILTLEQISALPRRIRSCELAYTLLDGAVRKLAVDDQKFYIDRDRPFNGETYRTRLGFNGQIHWSVDPPRSFNTRILPRVPGFKQVEMHPLNAPYLWVWGEPSEAVWSELQQQAAWDSVRQRMTYVGTRLVREQTCDVYVVDYPGMRYEVAFSRELEGFPIQIVNEMDGKEFSRFEIVEVRRGDGNAIIATKSQTQKPGQDAVAYHVVDANSIRVNQPLDPASFEPPQ
jgi:hypothetical protein